MSHYNAVLKVEDVFTITGRGTVVVGKVEKGEFHNGDMVTHINGSGTESEVFVQGLEMFHKTIERVQAGDNAGLLLGQWAEETVTKGFFSKKTETIRKIVSPPRNSFQRGDLIVKL